MWWYIMFEWYLIRRVKFRKWIGLKNKREWSLFFINDEKKENDKSREEKLKETIRIESQRNV